MTEISVTYERKFSDGNYGSEGLSLTITAGADPEGFNSEWQTQIASQLRSTVLTFLSESNAGRVAYAARQELNPPRPPVPAGPAQVDLEDLPF